MHRKYLYTFIFILFLHSLEADKQNYPINKEIKSIHSRKAPRKNLGRIPEETAITYSLSGGRLGDNLIAYFHAKWIAFKYDIRFLHLPFPYSDQFRLSELDKPLHRNYKFLEKISTTDELQIKQAPHSSLICIPYFAEKAEHTSTGRTPPFLVDWDDPDFRAEVRRCLTPRSPIKTITPPKDKITVAMHVRRGGGKDSLSLIQAFPLKFPPDSYYTQQLQKIADMFPQAPLYVHIFTDDLNPKAIAKLYRKKVKHPDIEFHYRTKNGPSANILEDFFSFANFDCLIIAQSNFSLMASKVGDHAMIISPINFQLEDDKVVITETEISLKNRPE